MEKETERFQQTASEDNFNCKNWEIQQELQNRA
jgi:hypothetical protein